MLNNNLNLSHNKNNTGQVVVAQLDIWYNKLV